MEENIENQHNSMKITDLREDGQVSASFEAQIPQSENNEKKVLSEQERLQTVSGTEITTRVQDIRRFYSPIKTNEDEYGGERTNSQSVRSLSDSESVNRSISFNTFGKIKGKARRLASQR